MFGILISFIPQVGDRETTFEQLAILCVKLPPHAPVLHRTANIVANPGPKPVHEQNEDHKSAAIIL